MELFKLRVTGLLIAGIVFLMAVFFPGQNAWAQG